MGKEMCGVRLNEKKLKMEQGGKNGVKNVLKIPPCSILFEKVIIFQYVTRGSIDSPLMPDRALRLLRFGRRVISNKI